MISYVRTPLFMCQNRFDALLVQALGLCLRCRGSDDPHGLHGRFIRLYGARMNETINYVSRALPRTGWFVPSEFHHDENFYSFFSTKQKSIGGMSMRAAIEAWYWNRRSVKLVEPTCSLDGPCASPAPAVL